MTNLHLSLFATLDAAQSNHGIPSQDYAQYHRYCTNRLSRLRHHRDVRSLLTHNHKYVEGQSGRRHSYCPRTIAEPVTHENVLWNIVFQAERAWATAMQHPRQRKAKLRKANQWASRLVLLTTTAATTPITQRECQSYAAFMKGNLLLEQQNFAEAYRAYKDSILTLQELVRMGQEQEEDTDAMLHSLTQRDVWMTRQENTVRPLLRFCQYQAKSLDPSELLLTTQLQQPSDKNQQGLVLNFQNMDIRLDDWQELAVIYLKLEDSLPQLQNKEESEYLELLILVNDALEYIAKQILRFNTVTTSGPAVQAKQNELQALQDYFRYLTLNIHRHQQEKHLQDLTDPADEIHVLDGTLSVVQQMLQQLQNNEHDDMLLLDAQAHAYRIRAMRCLALARYYAADNCYPQAMALLQQAKYLQRRAMEEFMALTSSEYYVTQLETLFEEISLWQCRTHAAHVAKRTVGLPLLQRLDEISDTEHLVDPIKPLALPDSLAFYDHAGGLLTSEPIDTSVLDPYIQIKKKSLWGSLFSS